MNIVLIFDQGLAGAGGKVNPNVELTAVKGGIGSSLMMEPHFSKIGATILATLYCGNQYFIDHQEEVVMKMTAMVKKLSPDYVICGPCFDFKDYARMSAMISASINSKTDIQSCAMMSIENCAVIDEFKASIPIIRMPKKGGTGLNESFANVCELIDASVHHPEKVSETKVKTCY